MRVLVFLLVSLTASFSFANSSVVELEPDFFFHKPRHAPKQPQASNQQIHLRMVALATKSLVKVGHELNNILVINIQKNIEEAGEYCVYITTYWEANQECPKMRGPAFAQGSYACMSSQTLEVSETGKFEKESASCPD